MIVQVVAIGILSALLAVTLKKEQPVLSALLGVAVSVLLFWMVLPNFQAVMALLSEITSATSIELPYVETVLKTIGIAYLCEFGAQICIDAGESAIAAKIDLAGKVVMMGLSAPILGSLLEQIVSFT